MFKILSKYNITFIAICAYVEFFILFVCLLLYPFIFLFGGKDKNKISNIVKNYSLSSVSFLSKIFLCTSFYVNDINLFKEMCKNKNYIITQNHLTELDSFVFFNMINSISDNFNLKTSIVLRSKTKMLVPSYGFLSLFGNDLYLERNFEKDINILSKNTGADVLYMFPEGTCYTQENKEKSNEYVYNNNLFRYKYVLYPRTKGLYNIIKSNEQMKYIYDLTVVFDTIKKEDFGKRFIVMNYFEKYFVPKRFFIEIKRYNIREENLKNEEDVSNFLKKTYLKKDKFINNFDPNINMFKLTKYNYLNGLLSFITTFITGTISICLFYNHNFVRIGYLGMLIAYFVNYYVKQIDKFNI
jgi:hypothetical protein